MRTITTTQIVPADEVTITTYGCEHCDFTADEQDAVAEHYGRAHACKGKMTVEGETLFKFDIESDAKAWLDAEYGGEGTYPTYRERDTGWANAGWYAVETYTKPCPRGCCTESCMRLFPAERLVWDGQRRARNIMREVTAIRRALREAGCEV